jgi:hypothetical protein
MTGADIYNASIEYFKNHGLGTFGVWYIGEKRGVDVPIAGMRTPIEAGPRLQDVGVGGSPTEINC